MSPAVATMMIDWSEAKRITLWPYEALISKLTSVLAYGFIHQHYNHTLAQAVTYSVQLQHSYRLNGVAPNFGVDITGLLQRLEEQGIPDYLGLLQQVAARPACADFLLAHAVDFSELLHLLNYLLRWVLPFPCPVRELLASIPTVDPAYPLVLKQQLLRTNLDVLARCRLRAERIALCDQNGLSHQFMLALVHRADLARLAFVRGRTVHYLCASGYDTLAKLSRAEIRRLEADLDAYLQTVGKRYANLKSVLPLDWMIGGASFLPRLVEE